MAGGRGALIALEEGDLDTVGAHARKLLGLAADLDPWDGTTTEREEERRDVAGALLRVAIPLLGAHRSADAQSAVEGALRLYPEHAELSFYRAMAMSQRGRAREAALAFDQIEIATIDLDDGQRPHRRIVRDHLRP